MTRIGVTVPVHGALVADGGALRMAVEAEAAGADGLWVGDHIVMLPEAEGYPFSVTGVYPVPADTDYFESLTLCAMMAAVTSHCRIGTAVLVLPQRNVLQLVKTATTISAVSGGRFALGVGAGWYAAEMEALGYRFDTRGTRMDEMLDVLAQARTGTVTGYAGTEVTVPAGVLIRPTPDIPVLLGGTSPAALRRAARRADGWIGVTAVNTYSTETIAQQLSDMRRALDKANRDQEEFELILKVSCPGRLIEELPAVLGDIRGFGFDEVIVQAPWALGMSLAGEVVQTAKQILAD